MFQIPRNSKGFVESLMRTPGGFPLTATVIILRITMNLSNIYVNIHGSPHFRHVLASVRLFIFHKRENGAK